MLTRRLRRQPNINPTLVQGVLSGVGLLTWPYTLADLYIKQEGGIST